MLRIARKLIMPKITNASYQNMTNAYKNKNTLKRSQLPHTWSMA
jgi:hypothetical protein